MFSDDRIMVDSERLAEIYENIKAMMEEHDLSEEEIDEILESIWREAKEAEKANSAKRSGHEAAGLAPAMER